MRYAAAALAAMVALALLALAVPGLRFLFYGLALAAILWLLGFFVHAEGRGRWYRW